MIETSITAKGYTIRFMKLFAELNRTQLKELAPNSLAVVPLGATEQHGPHLVTGTDYFTVEALSRAAAERVDVPVIVTPALPFGSSDHHLIFGGTMSLSTETYYRVLRELLESLVTDGFTRIFLVNGHGGNHELAQLACRDVALKHPVRIAAGSYWNICWDALIAVGSHKGRALPGHAGDFETSLMMAQRPELIPTDLPSRDNIPDADTRPCSPYRHERNGWWKDINGHTDSPANATAEKGKRDLEAIVAALAEAFGKFYRD
ncbi:MAG: creatininase family protein [Acidobacteria bacterium]|nr:creatininase family protein [Acidobacteriota bacterium]